MGNLNKSDFLIALIFGSIISLLCFQIQNFKKGYRSHHRKGDASFSSPRNPQSYRTKSVSNSKSTKNRTPIFQNDSFAYLKKRSGRSISSENEFTYENLNSQVSRDNSSTDRKLENYLSLQIGLSENEISRFLYTKRLMDDEILSNTQRYINPTDSDSTELNYLNQQTLVYYHEEFKQILGPENYQKYYLWQGEQDITIGENYSDGKPLSMDEI